MPQPLIASLLVALLLHAPGSFAGDALPATDRLKSCEPRIALGAAKEILDDPATLKEPLQIFYPAYTLFQNGRKDEAVFWLYAAQLRVRYQLAFEKGDRGQLLSIMLMTIGPPINNHALQDVTKLGQTIDQVLVWDRTSSNPFSERTLSKEVEADIEKVYTGIRNFKAKLLAEKDDLEQKARAAAPQFDSMTEQSRTRPCRLGKLDPAYANQTIEKEWLQVMAFVKNDKDVARAVGAVKGVGRESSTMKPGEIVPSRYTVSVGGDKSGYAIVDVLRPSGGAQFTLVCFTQLSLGQRDPHKDVCKQ